VAIITGSDSGIGKATAAQLAADGFDVGITWHRDVDGAERTAGEVRGHGRRAEVRQLDLSDLPDAAAVVDELAEALGGIDVLVNNSGTSRKGKAADLSYDDWRHTLAVDLDGAFLCAQRAARRMIDQGRLALLAGCCVDDGSELRRRRRLHARQPVSEAGRRVVVATDATTRGYSGPPLWRSRREKRRRRVATSAARHTRSARRR
jgi:NAD(P)-dependent dehydrogenase (short-subunit alcohol dehydrogenase family)